MKSHGDKTANNFTFYQVLTLNTTTTNMTTAESEKLSRLRQSCLDPGLYYKHAKSWLKYFPARQLIFLDGELLRSKPYIVLDQAQHFLLTSSHHQNMVNYRRMLVYDKKKGFYCVRQARSTGRSRVCLGASKGRHYPSLDERSREFLQRFYSDSNAKFASLLRSKFSHSPSLTWLNQKNINNKSNETLESSPSSS